MFVLCADGFIYFVDRRRAPQYDARALTVLYYNAQSLPLSFFHHHKILLPEPASRAAPFHTVPRVAAHAR
jgi:hypothetical protein